MLPACHKQPLGSLSTSSSAEERLELPSQLGACLHFVAGIFVSTKLYDHFDNGRAGGSLSENPDIVVGVIEAGEYVTDMMSIMIPGASSST